MSIDTDVLTGAWPALPFTWVDAGAVAAHQRAVDVPNRDDHRGSARGSASDAQADPAAKRPLRSGGRATGESGLPGRIRRRPRSR